MSSVVIILGIPVIVGCYQISKFTVYLGIATYRAVKAMHMEVDPDEDI